MELDQYHLRIPKYLMDRIKSEVIERWGYEVKGGIGLIISEVLEEKFKIEKTGAHTHIPDMYVTKENDDDDEKEKNELALHQTNPMEKRINHCINLMLPDIYEFASKGTYLYSNSKIGIGFLEKIISKKFSVYDKRSIKRYIDMLVTNGIIGDPEHNQYQKIVCYDVFLKQPEKEMEIEK